MVYHSSFNNEESRNVGGLPLLNLKTKVKGPANPAPADKDDIIDEALNFFKANVLYRNYEVEGGGDRLLIYLTLYISKCLLKVAGKSKAEADKLLFQQAIENFTLPGDKDFALGGLCTAPKTKPDAELLRQYLTQARTELNQRLLERVYARDPSKPGKWWMCFSKRKFLNKELK
eukprot:TRINITY_DN377_c0_g1_i2.p1 TRINITY_DN377_c0_g1~~TRINITY_DN377_c0_g1_i2.p1  ORF type:complete len:191 (+),score=70.36 TRINITY_DN377_c0_g1_i2:54-575(+)